MNYILLNILLTRFTSTNLKYSTAVMRTCSGPFTTVNSLFSHFYMDLNVLNEI